MMTIKAEAMAGSSIGQAFEQSLSIAKKLNCYVEFIFNDVTCCASPRGDVLDGVDKYQKEIKRSDKTFKYAMT